MDILNRLISYLFFSIFSTTISRIFVVCGVSIEFEKTRLDCKKKTNPKKPPKIQTQKYLTLKKVVEDATFHIIIQYCKYLKKKIMIYCKYGSRDFQNTFSNFSSVNQKGMILYWNKLERFPSMGAL